MSTLGKTISLKGELCTLEDLTVEGHFDGLVVCERGAVVLSASSTVTGDVIARDITVFGRVTGRLIATEVVDVRADAVVNGQVLSKRFILDAGAHFDGRVEPQHLEAALRVARFQQRKREAGAE
jgi:cytoskeletal protein CcmA (bactofilin family)